MQTAEIIEEMIASLDHVVLFSQVHAFCGEYALPGYVFSAQHSGVQDIAQKNSDLQSTWVYAEFYEIGRGETRAASDEEISWIEDFLEYVIPHATPCGGSRFSYVNPYYCAKDARAEQPGRS